ncbi:MAG: cobalamin biosynthesis protein CobD [Rhodospirillaceae bacterium]|nr:cobalamin biosynthesis protein CobD [Rhodospirillaceae bacterium]
MAGVADPWLVLGALAVEACVGYPAALHRVVPHPVTWIGRAIQGLDTRWNTAAAAHRKLLGICCILLVTGIALCAGLALAHLGAIAVVLAGTFGLAQRSLYDHVAAVAAALERNDLEAARAAVARIVGRDVAALDESGIAAAALESLAESFNDGILAPVFWFLVGGLPGLFAYKAVNTADSMIGHMEPRWRDFGWATARTDDVMNWLPARLAGALVALAGGGGWRAMAADARKHASPNAGWPEAAMAGALGVQLGGPVTYDGVSHTRPAFGEGARPTAVTLRRGLRIYVMACGLMWGLLALGGFAWRR